ncbi:hypothetical protein ACP4OV_007079 [Aristida adscensionis]
MDGGRPCAPEKRKISELMQMGSSSSPPPATDLGAEGEEFRSRKRRHQSLAAAGEQGRVDRLSALPDDVVGDILALLPTKEAGRAQVLAKQYGRIWRRAPLHLDGCGLPFKDDSLLSAVTRILASHHGPGRLFSVPGHLLLSHAGTMAAWFQSPALDGLQELDLCCRDRMKAGLPFQLHPPPPPPSTFRFWLTLRAVTLSLCSIPDGVAMALRFPLLQKLGLVKVNISEGSLHSLIATSPALECLLLSNSFGFRRVRINSPTLRSIGVTASLNLEGAGAICLEEVVIENAPCLRSFIYPEEIATDLRVSVIAAPKLETLGLHYCENHSSPIFMFGSTVIQGVNVIKSTEGIFTIKTLSVNLKNLSLDRVIELIKCFPCLEKLYIQCERSRETNCWRRKHRNLLKSLHMRLKTVVLRIYRHTLAEAQFVRFFILNAKMMETMVLEGVIRSVYEAFRAEQYKKLEVDKRACRGANLYFTARLCREFPYARCVHDLSKKDPYECTCPRRSIN